jgi:hypothetical protein
MALAYQTGGTSYVAASWSDATGFADNATLIQDAGTQNITAGLNAGSGLATGISYYHGRKGFTGTVGDANAGTSLETKFANYTTLPNIQWTSGTLRLICTNTCNKIRVLGGTVVILSGTVTDLEVVGGTVLISASATYTNLTQWGGTVKDLATGTNTVTAATIYGGTFNPLRPVTTIVQSDASGSGVSAPGTFLTYDNATGPTTWTIRGGQGTLLQGSIGTLNGYAGKLDATRANRDLTIGSTATNLAPFIDFRPTSSGATVTVSNVNYLAGGPVPPLSAAA